MRYILLSFIFIFSLFSLEATTPAKVRSKTETLSVNEVISDGKYLKLSDGSDWEVEPDAIPLTGSWLLAPKVTIVKSADPSYPYHLTNTTSNTTVLAKKVSVDEIPQDKILPPTQRPIQKTPQNTKPKPPPPTVPSKK